MQKPIRKLAAVIFLLACSMAGTSRADPSVAYQTTVIPTEGSPPIPVAIWYPTNAPTSERAIGPFMQSVATNGPVVGKRLPLIVISHGNGGSKEGHSDTALALAKAGFVVAALEHSGDNYRDQRRATDLANRPRELGLLISFMLNDSQQKSYIDAKRIGAFGFSSGAFTVLAAAGGTPDLNLIEPHCRQYPRHFACQLVARDRPAPSAGSVMTVDRRIGAIVVAAPVLGFVFEKGLGQVRLPVQLWRADADTILPAPFYADAVRNALPVKPDFRAVPNAGHFDFLAPCSAILRQAAPFICQSADGFDRSEFHARFNADVIDFFRRKLRR